MKLFYRLMLLGAVLPSVLAAALLGAALLLFARALDEELDRALLAQAAVEAVSLFDGPDGRVHLHMKQSPLIDEVRRFAPEGAVYNTKGEKILEFPDNSELPERMVFPVHKTFATIDDGRARRLVLPVSDAKHQRQYALALQGSRVNVRSAVSDAALAFGASSLLLFATLTLAARVWAKRLAARVHSLEQHMVRLQNGDLSGDLPLDDSGDELSVLRSAIADATRELRAARTTRDRFVADASHELRTPLATLRMSLDLALRKERSHTELLSALHEAREETVKLTALATALLDATQPPRPRAHVAMDGLVDDVLAEWQTRATQKHVALRRVGEASASVDVQGLRRALINLVDNAMAHTKEQTEVTVSLHRIGGQLRVVVQDGGDGIAPDVRPHVFAAFVRGTSTRPGYGLGLALVRDVARQHGGDAFVEDGLPSRIGFTLPLSAVSGTEATQR